MKKIKVFILVSFCIMLLAGGAVYSANYTVTNTSDTGAGTLRQAMTDANLSAGNNVIFNIPTTDPGYSSGVWTIRPSTPLPSVAANNTYIDGSSQKAFIGGDPNAFGPEIEICGNKIYWASDGIVLNGNNDTLREVVITSFTNYGLRLTGTTDSLYGCYIGIDPTGSFQRGNSANNGGGSYWGGQIGASGSGHIIGSTATADRNIISGSHNYGIYWNANNCKFKNNYLGTDRTGTKPVPNEGGYNNAIFLGWCAGNVIGGLNPGEGNIIAFNTGASDHGVRIGGDAFTVRNIVSGNSMFQNAGRGIYFEVAGANYGMPMPWITSANTSVITGTAPATSVVEVFIASVSAGSGNYGQGKTYIGSTTADSSQNWSLTLWSPYTGYSLVGASVTATATIVSSGTSEFSLNRPVIAGELTPPSAVTDLTATGATISSVSLRWTAPGDDGNVGTATTYDIRYAQVQITTSNWSSAIQCTGEPAPLVSGTIQTFTVNGLSQGVTYYFAMKTADEVPNVSNLSNNATRVTDVDSIAPAAVANVTATGKTLTSVDLRWTSPGDDGAVGTATTYDIRYSPASGGQIDDTNWAAATQCTGEPAPQVAGTVQTFTVYNLAQSTTYYFAMKTADEVPNWSLLSNIAVQATDIEVDTTPPTAVGTLVVTSKTATNVTLRWTATGDNGNTGTATTYDIRYAVSQIDDTNWTSATQCTGEPAPQISGTVQTFVVNGLSQATTYYFAMKAGDEVPNWSAISNVVSQPTDMSSDNTPPAQIIDLLGISATQTSITLQWTSPGDDVNVGTATVYDIRYSQSLIDDTSWASATQCSGLPLPAVAGTQQTFTVNGLSAGIQYYFAIKSADAVNNWSLLSNVAVSTTQPPSPVLVLSADTLDFGKIDAGKTRTLFFNITNTGGSTLSGTISVDKNWIIVTPVSFSGNQTNVSVKADNSVLNQMNGNYTGIVTVTSNGGTQTVNIKLTATCVLVSPNPYNPAKGNLTFFGDGIVPGQTTIKIYTLNGELIREIAAAMPRNDVIANEMKQSQNEIKWDGTNESGQPVSSGIYIYIYDSPKEKGIAKFTVKR